MADDIPQWAKERACTLSNMEGSRTWWVVGDVDRAQDYTPHTPLIAFARYIAAHEQPPVDPIREEAIKLVLAETVTRTDNQIEAIRSGQAGEGKVALVIAALRRGMELAK